MKSQTSFGDYLSFFSNSCPTLSYTYSLIFSSFYSMNEYFLGAAGRLVLGFTSLRETHTQKIKPLQFTELRTWWDLRVKHGKEALWYCR